MVDQLRSFAVGGDARGARGRHGRQARRPGRGARASSGTWKDLTDNVNLMAGNLTSQVRNIADVTTAVASGDLSKKITVDVQGEILELKDTINTMVDQLTSFAAEVTRVAREVGTEGKLGGQAEVRGRRRHVEGPDRQRELDGRQPDEPGAQHRGGHDGGRERRPLARRSRSTCRARSSSSRTRSTRWSISSRSFAAEVTRVAREVGTEGKLGGQAEVAGVAGTWKDLTDNVNSMAGEPDEPGAQHRGGHDGRRERRPLQEDHGRRRRARSSS